MLDPVVAEGAEPLHAGRMNRILRWSVLPGLEFWQRSARSPLKLYLDGFGVCSLESRCEGDVTAWYRGKQWQFGSASVVCVEPFEVFVVECGKTPMTMQLFSLPVPLVARELASSASNLEGMGHCPVHDTPDIWGTFQEVRRGLQLASDALECEQQARFLARVALVGRSGGTARLISGCDRAVTQAKGLLRTNLVSPLTLDDVAREVRVSKYYLARSFARSVGVTPFEYRRLARVRFALALLRDGHTTRTASRSAGFVDEAHFSRALKAYFGVTPGMYRAAGGPPGSKPLTGSPRASRSASSTPGT